MTQVVSVRSALSVRSSNVSPCKVSELGQWPGQVLRLNPHARDRCFPGAGLSFGRFHASVREPLRPTVMPKSCNPSPRVHAASARAQVPKFGPRVPGTFLRERTLEPFDAERKSIKQVHQAIGACAVLPSVLLYGLMGDFRPAPRMLYHGTSDSCRPSYGSSWKLAGSYRGAPVVVLKLPRPLEGVSYRLDVRRPLKK